jgi:8-oxo-dGTP pyrophosphatase MutT (NUDIX family)
VIDNKITWWIDTNGTYWHESIGVLIQNDLNQILCLNRCIYPFALALPAGHLDRNEEPLLGAQREVREETGIIDLELQLLKKFSMEGDSCARGCDDHQWSLFIGRVGENPTLEVCDEAKSLVWLSVPELLARNDVSYALSYILKHFYKESSGQFA